jgi:hypothetical protein
MTAASALSQRKINRITKAKNLIYVRKKVLEIRLVIYLTRKFIG